MSIEKQVSAVREACDNRKTFLYILTNLLKREQNIELFTLPITTITDVKYKYDILYIMIDTNDRS